MTIQKIKNANPYLQKSSVSSAMPGGVYQSVLGETNVVDVPRNDSYPVKYVTVSTSSSGFTNVVVAVPGKKIKVVGYQMTANGAVIIYFASASTPISQNNYSDAAGWEISVPYSEEGYFETAINEALRINLGGAVAVSVQVQYMEV